MKKAIKLNILNFIFTRHPNPEEAAASGTLSLSPCPPLSEKPHLCCHCLPNDHKGLITRPLGSCPSYTHGGQACAVQIHDMVPQLHNAVLSQHQFKESHTLPISRQTLLHLSCLWSISVPLESPALTVCSSLASIHFRTLGFSLHIFTGCSPILEQ